MLRLRTNQARHDCDDISYSLASSYDREDESGHVLQPLTDYVANNFYKTGNKLMANKEKKIGNEHTYGDWKSEIRNLKIGRRTSRIWKSKVEVAMTQKEGSRDSSKDIDGLARMKLKLQAILLINS